MARAVGREASGARLKPAALCFAAVAAALAGAFGALALAVVAGNPGLAAFDDRLGEALVGQAGAPIGAVLSWLSALHAPRGIAALTALASVSLWRWRDRAGVAVLLASVLGGTSINHALKHAFQRPSTGPGARPLGGHRLRLPERTRGERDAALRHARGAGGDADGLAAGALVTVAAAVLVVACIACSRVVLGAHRVSDVLAGALVGLAWMAVCLALRGVLRRSDPS